MFEHSLLQTRHPIARTPLLAGAAALHGLVLGSVLIATSWNVDAVAPPPEVPVFVTFAEPRAPAPPPPPPPAAASTAAVVEATPEQRAETVQPQVLPETLTPPVPPTAPAAAGGVLGGAEGGQQGGVVGGDPIHGVLGGDPDHGVVGGTGVTPFGAGTASADEPIAVGGAVEPPVALVRVEPRYTETARRIRLEGTVVVQATVDRAGRVTDVQVVKALPMGLDAAAVEAVRQWRFRPATRNGRPVAVFFRLTVGFRIQ